jgi:hypothetical protein|tara:strand:- start:38 stop:211 length:174 start_codon:yes stop_codon:yes gene_type:complete
MKIGIEKGNKSIKVFFVWLYLKYILLPYIDLRNKLGIPHIPKDSKFLNSKRNMEKFK